MGKNIPEKQGNQKAGYKYSAVIQLSRGHFRLKPCRESSSE